MDESETRARTKEEAAGWLLRLQAGEPSREPARAEREAFIDWLRESPLHVAEMLRITNVHDSLARFQRWDEVDSGNPLHAPDGVTQVDFGEREHTARSSTRSMRRGVWMGTLAAGILIFIIGGLGLRARGQTIETDRGERREITLSDGSIVQVDPQTTLRVRFDEGARRIELLSGRAVFKVARNPHRAFSVRAEDTVVRAVGTAFGVERRNSGVRVTVSEGKVAISSADPPRREPLGFHKTKTRSEHTNAQPVLLLAANEQVTVPPSGPAERVRRVNSDRELAWAKGRVAFEKEPVAAVIEEFNRYNAIQLRVESPDLARQPISGVFDASDPESFVAFLQSMVALEAVRQGDERITLTLQE